MRSNNVATAQIHLVEINLVSGLSSVSHLFCKIDSASRFQTLNGTFEITMHMSLAALYLNHYHHIWLSQNPTARIMPKFTQLPLILPTRHCAHAIPSHTIPYCTIPCHTTPSHIAPYHTKIYTISYHTITCLTIHYHTTLCHTMLNHAITTPHDSSRHCVHASHCLPPK